MNVVSVFDNAKLAAVKTVIDLSTKARCIDVDGLVLLLGILTRVIRRDLAKGKEIVDYIALIAAAGSNTAVPSQRSLRGIHIDL